MATTRARSAQEIRVEAAVATDVGQRRVNADAYLLDEAAGLFAVADGVGDTPQSILAAQTALQAVLESFRSPWSSLPLAERSADEARERLFLGLMRANARLFVPGQTRATRAMTTFAGAVVCARGLCIGHAGDSGVYRYRPSTGGLAKATEDDTVLNRALWSGTALDVALALPNAQALTRAIGLRPTLAVEIDVQPWEPGDVILVCSDGVTDALDSNAIARALEGPDDLQGTAQRLIQRAVRARGHDNATVVLVRWVL
jgi:serine/threonine protein phosphatase PrpC